MLKNKSAVYVTAKKRCVIKKVISVFLLSVCFLCSHMFFVRAENKLQYAIEPQYYSAWEFNKHGLAKVQLAPVEGVGEGIAGVINLNGDRIFGFDGTVFAIRKNGLIMAVGENDKAAFFDRNGKQLTDYIYETFKRVQPKTPHFVTYHYVNDLFDGDGESDLVPICREGKFGFINSKGEETIAPIFDYVFGFYEGIAKIGYNGVLSEYGTYTECKFGYINENGEVLPTGELWAADDFSYGYAKIADGQYKVIDKSGKEVQFPTGNYEFVETNGNFILARDGDELVVLDMSGKLLSGKETGYKALFGKSFIINQKQIADKLGNIIYTAPEGVNIGDPKKDSYVTTIYKRTVINRTPVMVKGLANQDGEVVLEPQYLGLEEVADGVYSFDGFELFDINGNIAAIVDGYNCGGNNLSYKLLPITDSNTHKRGYVELPQYDVLGEEIISDWAKSEVSEAIEKGLVPEEFQNNYTKNITREEFAVLTVNFVMNKLAVSYEELENLLENNSLSQNLFYDCDNEYVLLASRMGIIKGMGGNLFAPDLPITREQAATMLKRTYCFYNNANNKINPIVFEDSDKISDWAMDGVAFCVSNGVMKGVSDTQFSPQEYYTRQQALVTFLRLYNICEQSEESVLYN